MRQNESAPTPAQHKISKPVMVDSCDVASNNTGIYTLLTNVNRLQALEAGMIITQKAVHPQQTHHTKVSQNLQYIAAPTAVIVTISGSKLFKSLLLPLQNLNDIRLLHKCLQEVEYPINIPGLYREKTFNYNSMAPTQATVSFLVVLTRQNHLKDHTNFIPTQTITMETCNGYPT